MDKAMTGAAPWLRNSDESKLLNDSGGAHGRKFQPHRHQARANLALTGILARWPWLRRRSPILSVKISKMRIQSLDRRNRKLSRSRMRRRLSTDAASEKRKESPPKGREFLVKISRLFPDCEVAALYADSRVGHFGYSAFERGELIRCSFGEAGAWVKNYGSRMPFEESYLSSTYQSFEKEGRTFYKLNALPNGEELPDSAMGEELAAELFHAFTGFKIGSAEAAKVVGVGFLESQLRFDPQKLLPDPEPSLRRFGRQSARPPSWRRLLRNPAWTFAAIVLVWALLMATR
jgi:hypothetical protein